MTAGAQTAVASGDLTICPESGQVLSATGEACRLSPVNMKVLMALVSRAGTVVSRGDVFETVWGRQIVSEDALTRSISDIRAELRRLSGRDDYIETLPKRGYRWTADVTSPAALRSVPPTTARSDPPAPAEPPSELPRTAAGRTGLSIAGLLGRGLAYVAALVAMASLIVWGIDRIAGPGPTVVAVLPLTADAALHEPAARLDMALTQALLQRGDIDLLARSAIDSRPSNPFPYFFFEFGARWLIESELISVDSKIVYTVGVVDARTGVVLLQANQTIDAAAPDIAESAAAIEAFLVSRMPR